MDIVSLYYLRHPPTDASVDPIWQVQNQATSAAAVAFNWTTALGANTPKGTVLLYVQAATTAATVRFTKAGTAAATTLTNGVTIPAGGSQVFHVDPVKHAQIDVISTGAGTMQCQVVSQPYMRNNQ